MSVETPASVPTPAKAEPEAPLIEIMTPGAEEAEDCKSKKRSLDSFLDDTGASSQLAVFGTAGFDFDKEKKGAGGRKPKMPWQKADNGCTAHE